MNPDTDPHQFDVADTIFRRFLRTRGLKYTPERRAILEAVLQNDQHFEAEQLLFELRGTGQRVAKATIYRTLPLLVECGILNEVRFGDKWVRYEHAYGHTPHDHMVCTECGRIIEFDASEPMRMAEHVAGRHGFTITSHRFQIQGLCAACAPSTTKSRHSRSQK